MQVSDKETNKQERPAKALVRETSLFPWCWLFSYMPLFAWFIGFIRLLFHWINDKAFSMCFYQGACYSITDQCLKCLEMTNAKHVPRKHSTDSGRWLSQMLGFSWEPRLMSVAYYVSHTHHYRFFPIFCKGLAKAKRTRQTNKKTMTNLPYVYNLYVI